MYAWTVQDKVIHVCDYFQKRIIGDTLEDQLYFYIFSLPFQIAGALTLPLDVIKTHRQIEIGEKAIFAGQLKRRSRHSFGHFCLDVSLHELWVLYN